MAGMQVILGIFVLIVIALWIFLPFAVFGIKNRLDKMLEQSQKITDQLEEIAKAPVSDTGRKREDDE